MTNLLDDKRPTWDESFIDVAKLVARRSKDTSSKLGAVIVGPDKEIKSTGYNGFPRGVNDNAPERYKRPLKYKWFEHAERNAIYNFVRPFLKGSSIHLTWIPCTDCARGILQTGIVEVIIEDVEVEDRWLEDFIESLKMFQEARDKGLFNKVRLVNSDEDIIDSLLEQLQSRQNSSDETSVGEWQKKVDNFFFEKRVNCREPVDKLAGKSHYRVVYYKPQSKMVSEHFCIANNSDEAIEKVKNDVGFMTVLEVSRKHKC